MSGSAATVLAAGLVPDAVMLPVQYAVAVNDDVVAGGACGNGAGRGRFAHPSERIEATASSPQQNTNATCFRDRPAMGPRLLFSSRRDQARRRDEKSTHN